MAANEAPEKIWINPTLDLPKLNGVIDKESVQYVRTDAFINRAVEYIANNMRCDGYTLQTKAKFIKDFKNYMKGE